MQLSITYSITLSKNNSQKRVKMEILIISGDPIIPGIRESVNLNTLQIEFGKSDITVGDLLNYLKRKDSVLQQLSKNRELNLYYIKDGRPIFLKKEDRLRMYSGYETLYLSQELNYGTIEDRLPIRRTEEAPIETPVEMSEEAFSRFRWGFTTATGFLVFLWIAFSTWNTIIGSLFIVIFCYILAILYVYLSDNSIRYYYRYKIEFSTGPWYIADIIALFSIGLIFGAICHGICLELFPNVQLVLIRVMPLIIFFILTIYLFTTGSYKKLYQIDKNIRLILAIGGLCFSTLCISAIFKVNYIFYILLFSPVLSYFSSKKIFEAAISKRYDLFIGVFKDWFYKLRIAILILIIYYFVIGFSSFELDSTNIELDSTILALDSTNLKTTTNSIGMQFVLIPAGEFKMGSPSSEDDRRSNEGPVHTVTIEKAYYLGKYEVTQKQWREVMGSNPSNFKGDDLPVETVSWIDVQEFVKKLNEKEGTDKYRLPSEAEWEYAARAGTITRYSFGNDDSDLSDYAWYNSNSGSKTHPVGQKQPNPWGMYDMYGNVWERVLDRWHDDYKGAPIDGSAWEDDSSVYPKRVSRGGGWSAHDGGCRSATRYDSGPAHDDRVGFRLLQEV